MSDSGYDTQTENEHRNVSKNNFFKCYKYITMSGKETSSSVIKDEHQSDVTMAASLSKCKSAGRT